MDGIQRRVAIGMATGLALTIGGLAWSLGDTAAVDGAARLRIAVGAVLAIVACVTAGVGDVARRRFLSPADIGGAASGVATPATARAVATLTNTVEQAVIAMPVQLAVIALSPAPRRLALVLAGSFVTGRVLFALGYRHGAAGRAVGFALTFYPSVAGLALAAWFAVR